MKVLYIGSLQVTACATFYLNAFGQLGFETKQFDPVFFEGKNIFDNLLIRARKGPSPSKKNEIAKALISLCKENHFDAVFVMAENFLDKETIAEIRHLKKSAPIFLYHSHDNNFSDGICKPAKFFETLVCYDFVFTTKSQNVKRYKELGQPRSYFIPSAFEPSIHRPIPHNESKYGNNFFDVTFIGTYDRSREPYLDAVGWERTHIWGNGWKKSLAFKKYPDKIVPQAIYLDAFADILSHSKCTLGLLREEAADLHTQRTFEIAACGTLQIAPRNEEILSFFEEGTEIVCFSSLNELKEKVDYYLSHETERKAIIQKAYQRCYKDNHTYLDRAAKMFEIAGKESGRWSVPKKKSKSLLDIQPPELSVI